MMCFPPATVEFAWSIRVVRPAQASEPPPTPVRGDCVRPGRETCGSAARTLVITPGAAPGAGQQAASESVDVVKALDGLHGPRHDRRLPWVDDFLTFIRNAETGVKERGMFEGAARLPSCWSCSVGGLALNLTPWRACR